jgi:hypothetical protein
MQIYVAHSRGFDYKNELYAPIRNSALNSLYTFILPHETDMFINSKHIIQNSDLVIAEVSFPATGQGIELGWADSFSVPVICLYKKGTKPSGSLKVITKTIVSYTDSTDLVHKIEYLLSNNSH